MQVNLGKKSLPSRENRAGQAPGDEASALPTAAGRASRCQVSPGSLVNQPIPATSLAS
jgi:hypothetical protein